MSELPVRARLLALALGAIAAAAALVHLASSGKLTLSQYADQAAGGGAERVLLAQAYAQEPVDRGSEIVVCAALVEVEGRAVRLVNETLTARATTDYVNYNAAVFPSGTCTVLEAPNAVTNVLVVEVSGGGLTKEVKLRAAGRIMLAADELVAALLIANAVQSAVIAFLLYKVLRG